MVHIITETSFMNLNPEEQVAYEELRAIIGKLQAQENGLEKILNAVVATGNQATFEEIDTWVQGVKATGYDARSLTQLCHGPERLLSVESRFSDED